MSLFLLGIPIAIMGAKVLHDDIKYTSMDANIQKASYNITKQYQQIEKDFVNILQYSGAKCNIKRKANGYEISNVKKGQYGGLERYLAEKGYFPQAINYAKNRFDAIAEEERKLKIKQRDTIINNFETKLSNNGGNMELLTIDIKYVNYPKVVVEREVQRTINYLHNHYNQDVYCNIVMNDGSEPLLNHKEIWHLRVPKGEDAFSYFAELYDKLDIIYYGDD